MKISKDPVLGTYSIVGLDSDQLAYITGVVGLSHSGLNADGVVTQHPITPTAIDLYPALRAAAERFSVITQAEIIERSQWRWMNRLSLRERREKVAS